MDAPPSPKQKWALTKEDFDRLLAWLDPDRERAGERYAKISLELIKRFQFLHCVEPEDLANKTIDRVAQTLPRVIAGYKGDPVPYFYAVAYYVYREYLRLPAAGPLPETDLADGAPTPPELVDDDSKEESLDVCLSHCMEQLDKDDRYLILQYYRGERQEKIRLRKELSEQLSVELPYLRVLARRIRVALKKCILNCLDG